MGGTADAAAGAEIASVTGGRPGLFDVNAAATHAATKYLKGDAALSFAEDATDNAELINGQSD